MEDSVGKPQWLKRMAWVATMGLLVGVLLMPFAAQGRSPHRPPVSPPVSPPVGTPLSPPVGPPLSPPVGPPDRFFDFTSEFREGFQGCHEWIWIEGT
ncbi:MAG: hypothetical protein ACR2N7_11215, partial [Acidimicrobiia bacterium]